MLVNEVQIAVIPKFRRRTYSTVFLAYERVTMAVRRTIHLLDIREANWETKFQCNDTINYQGLNTTYSSLLDT